LLFGLRKQSAGVQPFAEHQQLEIDMSQNGFFVIIAIILALFGLGYLLIPDTVLTWYGAGTDHVGLLMARTCGASLIGLAVVYFMARDLTAGTALTGLLWAGLTANVLLVIVMVIATAGSVLNAVGWGQIVVNILLAAGFAYLLFAKPTQAQ
jgi:hypothetical protein